jgi:hypothetical protein
VLRSQLKEAHAHLKRLVAEREKLMQISNMLKADLSKAGGKRQLQSSAPDS